MQNRQPAAAPASDHGTDNVVRFNLMENHIRSAKDAPTIQRYVESITPRQRSASEISFTFDQLNDPAHFAANKALTDRKLRQLAYREALENEHCDKQTQRFIVKHCKNVDTLQTAEMHSQYSSVRKLARRIASEDFGASL